MKKIIVSAVALSTAFLASCNLNSSDEGNTEVASVEKLPDCNVKGGPSGDGMGGKRMYVEEDKAYYTCTGRGWMLSEVTKKSNLPKCSAKDAPELLGQAVLASKDSLYFVCLPSGWVKLDSSNVDPEKIDELLDPENPDSPLNPDSPENTPLYENLMVVGTSNVLAPFAEGSSVTIKEVAVQDDDEVSKNVHKGSVLGKTGDFLVPEVSVYSHYGEIAIKGVFNDPLTGEKTSDPLELRSLIEFNSSSYSVSIYDHLLSARAKRLMSKGSTYYDAFDQARNELYTMFNFDKDLSSSTVAFTVGLLLRADLSVKDFAKILNNIVKDFEKDGVWKDDTATVAIADFAFALHNSKLKVDDNLVTELDVRRNLEAANVSSVPEFAFYVKKFYENVYDLGVCGEGHQGVIVKNANKSSRYADTHFTCNDGEWYVSSDEELDIDGFGTASDGELKKGSLSGNWYVYDEYDAVWKLADPVVVAIGYSCTNNIENKVVSVDDQYYGCKDRLWKSVEKSDYLLGRLCGSDIYDNTKYYTLEGVNYYYLCNGNYNWEPISEETYVSYNYENDGKVVTIGGHSYIYSGSWRLVKDGELELGACNSNVYGTYKSFEVDGHAEYRYCDGNYNWITIEKIDFLAEKICDNGNGLGGSGRYVSYEEGGTKKYAYCAEYLGWVDIDEISFKAKNYCTADHYNFKVQYGDEGSVKYMYCGEPKPDSDQWVKIDYLTYNSGFCNNEKHSLGSAGYNENNYYYVCGCLDDGGDFTSDPSVCEDGTGRDVEWIKQ